MNVDRKKRLVELGPAALADALLELAMRVDAANEMIEQLIATPKESVRRYKAKLAGLKRRRRFISWGESGAFAYELEMLLADLQKGVTDPRTGVELVAAFYRADAAVFEQCDDSSGSVGEVFRFDAKERFVAFASECRDKQWLCELVFDLNQEDDYGVRDALVDCAAEYLPEGMVRDLIERCQTTAKRETKAYKKGHWLRMVQSLARQIKDAPLYEKTLLASHGPSSTPAYLDISRVYLESDEADTALSWLQRIPSEEKFQEDQRDQLLLETYTKLGDEKKQIETAWRIFRSHRSTESLAKLLEVIGHDQKAAVMAGEVPALLEEESFSLGSANFLVETGHLDAAETYLLEHKAELNGERYNWLLSLAEAMEAAGRWLCTSMIYRALLNSILTRARSKAYAHGAEYLRKLDALAEQISDWHGFEPHQSYLSKLRQRHARKRSFWPRYEK